MSIGIKIKPAISEIFAEQAELPHVESDVFADVADCAVGADDYFLVVFGDLLVRRLRPYISSICHRYGLHSVVFT